MQLDKENQPMMAARTKLKNQKITIVDDQLISIQHRRVMLFNIIPLLGCGFAIIQLSNQGFRALNISLFLIMHFLAVTGITVGYHRYLAHKSFQASKVAKIILTVLGSMAGQGPPIYWVANHRRHHQYSDLEGDPHSPHVYGTQKFEGLDGLWHAHVGWLFKREITNSLTFAKDLIQDPVISWINQQYIIWLLLGLIIPTVLAGILTQSWIGALSGFLWGGLARLFFSIQAGYVINSITHLFGSRPFDTREQSTNSFWLAIPTLGEAWHNNHHAFPNSAKFGLQWWQVDLGYLVIRSLQIVGLVSDVKSPTVEMIKAKKNN